MANIDLGNLTRYDGKIKEYAEDKYLSKNTANWQMTEKAGAVTCYPVPDTELEPIVNFSFKEIPPTSGDKSPTNPSTIEGVSSIDIGVHGKNLFRYNKTGTYAQVSVSVDTDGVITLNGTCNAAAGVSVYINDDTYYTPYIPVNTQKYLVAKIEHISGSYTGVNSSNQICNVQLRRRSLETGVDGFEWMYILSTDGNTAIKTWNYPLFNYINNVFVGAILTLIGGVSYNNYKIRVQYEFSDTLTPSNYESPIISSYTLSLGNTYYGGSVNLATGLMTVKYRGIVFTGQENADSFTEAGEVNNSGIYRHCYNITDYLAPRGVIDACCTHFNYSATSWYSENILFYPSNNFINFFTTFPTKVDFMTFLSTQYSNNTPVVVTYILANPYTVQFNSVQIKSLTTLDKNIPRLNTLYTDADSIQVGYQKHPARTSYELENAILALGGGE